MKKKKKTAGNKGSQKQTHKQRQAERKEERKTMTFQLQKVYSSDTQPTTRDAVAANE
jgi:hypothetical protein